MRKPTLFLASLFILFAACRREPLSGPEAVASGDVLRERASPAAVPQGDPISREELDRTVITTLEMNNDFRWDMVDLRTLWSATLYNDHSVSIGYKPAGMGAVDGILHDINIQEGKWRAVHDALIDLVLGMLNGEGRVRVSLGDILVEDDPVLPVITLRLTDKEVITRLYNLENTRYIEPLDYWPAVAQGDDRSSQGCAGSTTAVNAADHTTITPGAKLPWNFSAHNIPDAWNISQGSGITVGVIDAGLSSSQALLNGSFNNGDSNVGRAVSTAYTCGTSAFTSCTHGTSMSGTAVGPRNNTGATTGVAYKAGLAFVRGANDVILDQGAERTGVKNGLTLLSNNAQVRVISISLGTPISYGVLSDGINYAHGAGKLVFCAAGTSLSWTSWWGVIYPAAYANAVAVTGVKENGSKCASCHDGSQVDLTILMERNASSSRNSLSLAPSGNNPAYIGGSSVATSTAAGIAALVWSTRPNATRAQVLNCLTSTAQFAGAPSGSKGYGNINAQAAVNCALAL